MTQPGLVALVRGLQIACLVTWGASVVMRGGSLWRVVARDSRSRWDRQWSSITLFAATQVGFSLRWLVYGDTMAAMRAPELASWAVLYLSSALSAIGVVIEHGWWTDARHRAAMALHALVIALSIAAAAMVA